MMTSSPTPAAVRANLRATVPWVTAILWAASDMPQSRPQSGAPSSLAGLPSGHSRPRPESRGFPPDPRRASAERVSAGRALPLQLPNAPYVMHLFYQPLPRNAGTNVHTLVHSLLAFYCWTAA